ncbi:hypothetical protein [Paraburkholderia aspalathi]|uniref:hypothetical protein n=1 Tax=Paraburkholderia aspalathi TaxID=1324617 RepID=UPI001B10F7C3|nr:hypothetical protein [Paraburkholderia aspalathi]CAE6701559.1 hypothetical protein R20943_00595 [Paraburkholderia aspalathi]
MDVFEDFHKIYNSDHPNISECLQLRADELALRTRKRMQRFNDRIAFVCSLPMLFMSGVPLQMIWQFGLGAKISSGGLLLCCAGFALGLFLLTAPWRHRGRQRALDELLTQIEAKLKTLNCPSSTLKLDGNSERS